MYTLNKILELLDKQGKQQKDLAEFLGINKNNITDWKSGKSRSYTKYLPQSATFLGVSVDYLVGSVGSLNDELFRYLDSLCKKANFTFAEAMKKSGITDEEIVRYYSGERGIIFSYKDSLSKVLGDDGSLWANMTFSNKEKPSDNGELDEIDNEIIKVLSSLSAEKKKAALEYLTFLSRQENGDNWETAFCFL